MYHFDQNQFNTGGYTPSQSWWRVDRLDVGEFIAASVGVIIVGIILLGLIDLFSTTPQEKYQKQQAEIAYKKAGDDFRATGMDEFAIMDVKKQCNEQQLSIEEKTETKFGVTIVKEIRCGIPMAQKIAEEEAAARRAQAQAEAAAAMAQTMIVVGALLSD